MTTRRDASLPCDVPQNERLPGRRIRAERAVALSCGWWRSRRVTAKARAARHEAAMTVVRRSAPLFG
jgi:hypothetical protein